MKYLIAAFLLFTGFTQESNNPNLIYWAENAKLEWKDFKAAPQNHPTHKAMSSLTISIDMLGSSDSVIVTSKSTFDRSKSWVKPDWQTPRVLDHEQIHFNIRELYTRQLKKAISERQFKRKTVQLDLNNMFKNANIDYNKAQMQYDQESYTSEEKQNGWKSKIDQEIQSLASFRDPVVKIMLTN